MKVSENLYLDPLLGYSIKKCEGERTFQNWEFFTPMFHFFTPMFPFFVARYPLVPFITILPNIPSFTFLYYFFPNLPSCTVFSLDFTPCTIPCKTPVPFLRPPCTKIGIIFTPCTKRGISTPPVPK